MRAANSPSRPLNSAHRIARPAAHDGAQVVRLRGVAATLSPAASGAATIEAD